MSTQERIVELEVRIAYQDKTIAELDDVVRSFTKRVEELEREVERLREATLESPPPTGPANDPPPHY